MNRPGNHRQQASPGKGTEKMLQQECQGSDEQQGQEEGDGAHGAMFWETLRGVNQAMMKSGAR
jgi:hypothetical protein